MERLRPDLVVIDLQMPGIGGVAGVARLRERHPELPVLVLSMHDQADDVRRAFEAGAAGYLVKTAADEELVRAVRAVAGGERYVHPSLGAVLAQPPRSRGPVDDLSPREQEVLRLLALGYTNHEIADRLYVSVRTVESHRAHVMAKLRVNSRAGMVRARDRRRPAGGAAAGRGLAPQRPQGVEDHRDVDPSCSSAPATGGMSPKAAATIAARAMTPLEVERIRATSRRGRDAVMVSLLATPGAGRARCRVDPGLSGSRPRPADPKVRAPRRPRR